MGYEVEVGSKVEMGSWVEMGDNTYWPLALPLRQRRFYSRFCRIRHRGAGCLARRGHRIRYRHSWHQRIF